jgi:hypothetical protein
LTQGVECPDSLGIVYGLAIGPTHDAGSGLPVDQPATRGAVSDIVAGMSKPFATATVFLALLHAPTLATADREVGLANLLGAMGNAVRWEKPNPSNGDDEIRETHQRCRDALDEAKKEGVKPGDLLVGNKDQFKAHPKAKLLGEDYAVKFADAAWFCDELDKRLSYWDMVFQLDNGLDAQRRLGEGITDRDKSTVEGHEVEYWLEAGRRCKKAVEQQLAGGLLPETVIEGKRGKVMLSEAGPVCDALTAWAGVLQEAYKARFAELSEKYKAVGIGGDRLELFVYYDGQEWYLKGCQSSTEDPKQLKKAKVLFQWLTDSYGVITVRKYSFKGDKFTISEKTFLTEAAAYKGCK